MLLATLLIFGAIVLAQARNYVPATPPSLCAGTGSGAGECFEPKGIAVDQSNGHIYITDQGNNRIDEFEPNGTFVKAFGRDVIPLGGAGDTGEGPEVCTAVSTCKAGATSGAGSFGIFARGIAVDPATHVVYAAVAAVRLSFWNGTSGAFLGSTEGNAGEVNAGAPEKFAISAGAAIDYSSAPQHYLYLATQVNPIGSRITVIDKFAIGEPFDPVGGPEGIVAGSYVCQLTGTEVATKSTEAAAPTECGGNGLAAHKDGAFEGISIGNGKSGTPNQMGGNLAVNSAGDVYVAEGVGGEVNRQTVSVFGSNGDYVTQFRPAAGCGPDPRPEAVAALPGGNVLLADCGTGAEGGGSRVQEFSAASIAPSTPPGITEPAPISEFGNGTIGASAGIAADSSGLATDGRVYATDSSLKKIWSFAPILLEVSTGQATEIEGTSETLARATLGGTINPKGQALSECFFEYGQTTAYGQTAPCEDPDASEIGSGNEPVAVHADVSGLEIGNEYHFQLVVKSGANEVPGNDSPLPLFPPAIGEAWTQGANETEATLEAKIDPEGYASGFHLEYLSEAAFEANGDSFNGPNSPSVAPVPDASVGSDQSAHEVSVDLEGLAPGTAYRWRVVATNQVGVSAGEDLRFATFAPPPPNTSCPNQAFRIGPSAALPDCRAYEMVSPVDKNGGDIVARSGPENSKDASFQQASLDGGRVTYTSTTAFGDAQRGAIASQYLSSRHPLGDSQQGWSTHGLNPPQGTTVFDPASNGSYDNNTNFLAFSEDLCAALVKDHNLEPLSEAAIHGFTDLYRRENCGPGADGYEALTTGVAPAFSLGPENLGLRYASFSRDGNHLVFGAQATLESTPPPFSGTKAQIYDFAGGELHLVSVLPGGGVATDDSAVGSAFNNNDEFRRISPLEHAIAADGSRIFWTAAGKIYLRENPAAAEECSAPGEAGKACTVQVSLGSAQFITAAISGSQAIYSEGADLYRFDVGTETRTLVAGETGGSEGAGAVAGSSDDLSYLYFTSKQALAPGAPALSPGEKAAQVSNLYLEREGTKVFIAKLTPADRGVGVSNGPGAVSSIDSGTPLSRSARASADGRRLAFMSNSAALAEQAAEYDNTDASTGEAASEVYIYDADTGELACASCNPSGARPAGQKLPGAYTHVKGLLTKLQAAAWLATCEWGSHCKRTLSVDGNRLFFNSFDSLVPADVNGVQDVYEWEAVGTGGAHGCHVGDSDYFAQDDGCLSLISSGHSGEDSELLDASGEGRDVFFTTQSSLDEARDRGSVDIYDARVEGGFPPPPPPPPPCLGDACQPIPTPPGETTPASAAFRGPGDPTTVHPRPCPRGKHRARRGGKTRCLGKRSAHRSQPRRSRRVPS